MLVNLTPHPIHFVNDSGEVYLTLPPTLPAARCNTVTVAFGYFDGVPLTVTKFGSVTGLPEPAPGTLYIVSLVVRQASPDREDLASPGQVVRDSQGNIIGCKSLDVNSH